MQGARGLSLPAHHVPVLHTRRAPDVPPNVRHQLGRAPARCPAREWMRTYRQYCGAAMLQRGGRSLMRQTMHSTRSCQTAGKRAPVGRQGRQQRLQPGPAVRIKDERLQLPVRPLRRLQRARECAQQCWVPRRRRRRRVTPEAHGQRRAAPLRLAPRAPCQMRRRLAPAGGAGAGGRVRAWCICDSAPGAAAGTKTRPQQLACMVATGRRGHELTRSAAHAPAATARRASALLQGLEGLIGARPHLRGAHVGRAVGRRGARHRGRDVAPGEHAQQAPRRVRGAAVRRMVRQVRGDARTDRG